MILIGLLLFVQAAGISSAGCGGEEEKKIDEELAVYALENILLPEQRDSDCIVAWMRESTGIADVSPDELGLRFWKWEGGVLSEISLEEYEELAAQRVDGDPRAWTYSQHSITVLEVDEEAVQAVVEIGSLYNPLAGSGIRYLLREEDGKWTKISEQTVWRS